MTSKRICKQHGPLASLVATVAVGVALSVHAAYSATSSDDDVKDSCKDFSVNTYGVMSATCNVWSSHGTVFRQDTHKIDLDHKVGFDGSALQYNQNNFTGQCDDLSVSFGSDRLTLKATCDEKSVSIRIDDMMYNLGGEYAGQGTVGLYWRSARWSD